MFEKAYEYIIKTFTPEEIQAFVTEASHFAEKPFLCRCGGSYKQVRIAGATVKQMRCEKCHNALTLDTILDGSNSAEYKDKVASLLYSEMDWTDPAIIEPLSDPALIESIKEQYCMTELPPLFQCTGEKGPGLAFKATEGDVVLSTRGYMLNTGRKHPAKDFFYRFDEVNPEHSSLIVTKKPIEADIIKYYFPDMNVVSLLHGEYQSFRLTENQAKKLKDIRDIVFFNFENEDVNKIQQTNFLSRLGTSKIKFLRMPTGELYPTLANDPAQIKSLIQEKINENLDGLVYLGRHITAESINDVMKPFMNTGIFSIDRAIRGIRKSELTLLVGRSSEGKSTLTSQIALNAVGQGVNTFLYSGEMKIGRIERWLATQLLSRKEFYTEFSDEWGNTEKIYNNPAVLAMKLFLDDKLILADNNSIEGKDKGEALLQRMEQAYRRDGVQLFIIDNLMSITSDSESDRFVNKSEFTKQLAEFKNKFNVHIILVVHPNKEKRENRELTKFDISGLSDIPNAADNILIIERHFPEGDQDEEEADRTVYDGTIAVDKNREYGELCSIRTLFDSRTKTFRELNVPEQSQTMLYFSIDKYYEAITQVALSKPEKRIMLEQQATGRGRPKKDVNEKNKNDDDPSPFSVFR